MVLLAGCGSENLKRLSSGDALAEQETEQLGTPGMTSLVPPYASRDPQRTTRAEP
jgi:hypothetical protein